jgi:hypothetical protein
MYNWFEAHLDVTEVVQMRAFLPVSDSRQIYTRVESSSLHDTYVLSL